MKERAVVFRSYQYRGETIGYAVWNATPWLAFISTNFGFPAHSSVHLWQLCSSENVHTLISREEANRYLYTNDSTPQGKTTLAHLFLFSNAERNAWHLNHQPPAFYFVTKRGFENVRPNQWFENSYVRLDHMTQQDFQLEMDRCNRDIQVFLEQVTNATHNPNTPEIHLGEPTRFILLKQRREVPEVCLPLFDRVLSCSALPVHRPMSIANEVFPVETQDEII